MIPDIDRLRAHRWVNELNQERRRRGADGLEYGLAFGSATIELVERSENETTPLVRFRYTKTRSEWRVQQQTPEGRYRAVPDLVPTRYLAELLAGVVELRAQFVPSLSDSRDLLV